MPLQVLRIVKTSLVAQRAAMEVVSQNISNAATPCYTRQRAIIEPIAATRLVDPTRGGQGVRVDYVQRLWDARLMAQIGFQRGLKEHAENLAYGLERIEGLLGDMEQGIHTLVGDFFNAWDVLGADGASLGARREVIGAAKALADALRLQVARLHSFRQDIEGQMNDLVTRANELLQRVAELNKQVMGGQGRVGGNIAAVQRDQACEELAKLLGCTVMAQPDGSVSVLIGGIQLVDKDTAVTLHLVPDASDPTVHNIEILGHINPDGMAGQAQALLDVRDDYIPAFLQRLDQLAQGIADAVNAQHQAGYDLNGDSGGMFFQYDASSPAGTIQVDNAIESDINLIAASSVPDTTSDGGNAFMIGALRYQPLFGAQTAEQYAADLLAEVGADVEAAQQAALSRENIITTLEAKYQELFGVSVDEESVDLMRYQKAFIASARIARIVNEMMDSVLDLAG